MSDTPFVPHEYYTAREIHSRTRIPLRHIQTAQRQSALEARVFGARTRRSTGADIAAWLESGAKLRDEDEQWVAGLRAIR